MKTLRRTMHVSFGLPSPVWLLAIGAVIIKTETELILKSRWVIPQKLLDLGYTFKYPTLDTALKNIVSS
jgi:NAD dependent epimerase/dehydratase family enzyme